MSRTAKLTWGLLLPLGLVGLWFMSPRMLFDRRNPPSCHKQIHLALRIWENDERTNFFPNVNGSSSRSIGSLSNELSALTTTLLRDYHYVPGLRNNDPGDLVLFYLKKPTRWRLHVKPETVFTERGWIVVPVDFAIGRTRPLTGPGELSEKLSTKEFTDRLATTLDFLRTNNRPDWEAVVQEHSAFLQTLK